MKTYKVRIEMLTPLMHHRMHEDELMGLIPGAGIKKTKDKDLNLTPRSVADRHVYRDSEGFYIPAEYIMGALGHVASDYKQKGSSKKTLKGIIKGIVRPTMEKIYLKTRKDKPIKDYEVDIRKATNHQKGAIAVCRPRFDDWAAEFELTIGDELISPETCLQILEDSGRRAGIGSFRVQRGGYFGQFQVTKWESVKD